MNKTGKPDNSSATCTGQVQKLSTCVRDAKPLAVFSKCADCLGTSKKGGAAIEIAPMHGTSLH